MPRDRRETPRYDYRKILREALHKFDYRFKDLEDETKFDRVREYIEQRYGEETLDEVYRYLEMHLDTHDAYGLDAKMGDDVSKDKKYNGTFSAEGEVVMASADNIQELLIKIEEEAGNYAEDLIYGAEVNAEKFLQEISTSKEFQEFLNNPDEDYYEFNNRIKITWKSREDGDDTDLLFIYFEKHQEDNKDSLKDVKAEDDETKSGVKELTDFLRNFNKSEYEVEGGKVIYKGDLTNYAGRREGPMDVLPESIGLLEVEGTLSLSENYLDALPESFGNVKVKENLGLSGNYLTSLSGSFANVRVGGDLYLNNNELTTLPENFGDIQVGGLIDLEDNPFVSLPASILKIPFDKLRLDSEAAELYNALKEWESGELDDDEDSLEDGNAAGMTVEDIAKKHGVAVKQIEDQVEIGKKIEMEHTNDEREAEIIALDHLSEFADYYDRLVKMEEEAKKGTKVGDAVGHEKVEILYYVYAITSNDEYELEGLEPESRGEAVQMIGELLGETDPAEDIIGYRVYKNTVLDGDERKVVTSKKVYELFLSGVKKSKSEDEDPEKELQRQINWCKAVLTNPKGRAAAEAKSNYGKNYIKLVKEDLKRFENQMDKLVKSKSEDESAGSLTFKDAVLDSYNHFVSDLGIIPTVGEVFQDVVKNYKGFEHLDDEPLSNYRAMSDISEILQNEEFEVRNEDEELFKYTLEIFNEKGESVHRYVCNDINDEEALKNGLFSYLDGAAYKASMTSKGRPGSYEDFGVSTHEELEDLLSRYTAKIVSKKPIE